jgi:hypothetical protein
MPFALICSSSLPIAAVVPPADGNDGGAETKRHRAKPIPFVVGPSGVHRAFSFEGRHAAARQAHMGYRRVDRPERLCHSGEN